MKQALEKTRISESKAFVVKELVAPYFDKNWHFHQEYQLFLVLEGKGTRFVGDQMQAFKENDLVLTGPNLPHLWRNDQVYFEKDSQLITRGIVIYFNEGFLGDTIFRKEEFEAIKVLLEQSNRGLEIAGSTNLVVRKLMRKLLRLSGVDSVLVLLKILKIISESDECLPVTGSGYINNNKESEKDRMNKVYEYVIENFRQKILLADVAALANMTESAFSRYFASRMNKTFSEFLSGVRISHACKLLHEADMNISEICYECGFNTLSNFNKQFKDQMGNTPMAYKKKLTVFL
ncbi:AraC family transcriptional regulator [Pararhodonellum marinum]|uniref:AraC family transcriptional regulator n=1 Tax=Pararhodonellum marinum TaxID=2755358 RepID=UPI00188FBF85|nr:AraC family transcriptional regulator [Pararhodonellum marinum]